MPRRLCLSQRVCLLAAGCFCSSAKALLHLPRGDGVIIFESFEQEASTVSIANREGGARAGEFHAMSHVFATKAKALQFHDWCDSAALK